MTDIRIASAGASVLVDQPVELRVASAGASVLVDQPVELRVASMALSVLVLEGLNIFFNGAKIKGLYFNGEKPLSIHVGTQKA